MPWELSGYSDADYAVHNDNCKIITGYIVITYIAVVAWCFQSQKKVPLYVTESECSEIMKICC